MKYCENCHDMEKCEMYGGCWNPPAKEKPLRPSDATACSPSSDTPETDAHQAKEGMAHDWLWRDFANNLERERDEARLLCRWAFPRLRAMCHDFDATGTGWCCAEEMESHPEIFSSENAAMHAPAPSPAIEEQLQSGCGSRDMACSAYVDANPS